MNPAGTKGVVSQCVAKVFTDISQGLNTEKNIYQFISTFSGIFT